MRWTEHSLGSIPHDRFGRLSRVRSFANCTVFSAIREGRFLLILHDLAQRKLIVCEYDNEWERAEDTRYLLSLPGSYGPP